jgi:hypothetical protein
MSLRLPLEYIGSLPVGLLSVRKLGNGIYLCLHKEKIYTLRISTCGEIIYTKVWFGSYLNVLSYVNLGLYICVFYWDKESQKNLYSSIRIIDNHTIQRNSYIDLKQFKFGWYLSAKNNLLKFKDNNKNYVLQTNLSTLLESIKEEITDITIYSYTLTINTIKSIYFLQINNGEIIVIQHYIT